MKLCHPLICLAILIGLTASVCGQIANNVGQSPALKDLKPGIVVDHLTRKFEAERAGLHEGDVLLRWSRGDAKGTIESPFDMSSLEIEQEPRGPVTLEGLRGTKKRTWRLGTDVWGVQAHPNFRGRLLDRYREGQELVQQGKFVAGAERWHTAAEEAKEGAPRWLGGWLLLTAAELPPEVPQWQAGNDLYVHPVEQSAGLDPIVRVQLLKRVADDYRKMEDWRNAERYYLQALAESKRLDKGPLTTAAILKDLGAARIIARDFPKADEYLSDAQAMVDKTVPETLAAAAILNKLGDSARGRRDLKKAEEYYNHALAIRERLVPGSLDVSESFYSYGGLASDRNQLPEAEEYFARALAIRDELVPDSLLVAQSLSNLGYILWLRNDLDRSEACFKRALAVRTKLGAGELATANYLENLANIAVVRGHLPEAADYHNRAWEIRHRLAPGSLPEAASLIGLARISEERGNLVQAKDYYLQALAIQQRIAPEGGGAATSFNNLGMLYRDLGQLKEAEGNVRQALKIREKLNPGSDSVASSLANLGIILRDSGDLTGAEDYFKRSLVIKEQVAPGTQHHANGLIYLGEIAWFRRDLDRADGYYKKALVIQQEIAPGSLDVAGTFRSLGSVSQERGDFATAEKYYRASLEIQQKLAPGNINFAGILHDLSTIALERGDVASAELFSRQALGSIAKSASTGLVAEGILIQLGAVLFKKGDLAGAGACYRQAMDIGQKLGVGRLEYSETLAGLARIAVANQQPQPAEQLFEKALKALETQTVNLGPAESRYAFRAKYAGVYSEYVDFLLLQKKPVSAFQVLERLRARTMLELLAAAQVDFRKDKDPRLLSREKRLQDDIVAKSERRIRMLSNEHAGEQVRVIEKEISDLIEQHLEVEGEMRATSPNYAALTQPQPLSAQEVQQRLLDADTLLLEYLLGEEHSYVFAVTQTSVDAYEIPKRAELERTARQVYDFLITGNRIVEGETAAQRMTRLATAEAQYLEAATRLSRMVLGPVEPILLRKRLLIVSDGVLQYIPFAALPSPSDQATFTPLVVNHEIVSLPSASVLDVLRKESAGRSKPAKIVAVLADPVFDAHDMRVRSRQKDRVAPAVGTSRGEPDAATVPPSDSMEQRSFLRSAAEVGAVGKDMVFGRLFFSRQEADAILRATPPGQGTKALDFAASRAAATNPSLGEYRIVHFATHGLLNSEHPELSGLVLSLVDEQGKAQAGFLELADIYNLNLPVDMVVLSACETGLGKEIRGEGLVGLTRGFMYAGATRVVASLWKVDDAATAELMGRFYSGILHDGLQPAAALQKAQAGMRQQRRWSSPYYWAGFVMQGQW